MVVTLEYRDGETVSADILRHRFAPEYPSWLLLPQSWIIWKKVREWNGKEAVAIAKFLTLSDKNMNYNVLAEW